ncbi:MAG: hypothetical protein ABW076_10725 [Candidatus Thiodiazotropha sp.]
MQANYYVALNAASEWVSLEYLEFVGLFEGLRHPLWLVKFNRLILNPDAERIT